MSLRSEAEWVAELLALRKKRLVLAESCTGGLIASELTAIRGISKWFCGSAVTYRNEAKKNWLGVRAKQPVSLETVDQMVRGLLRKTPEASMAAAVSGHLGPDAPRSLDGVVCFAAAFRDAKGKAHVILQKKYYPDSGPRNPMLLRRKRRRAASQDLLRLVRSLLS